MSAGLAALMLAAMATAFGTAPTTVTYQGKFNDIVESIAIPAFQPVSADIDTVGREIRIQRGDTVSELLARMGINDGNALAFLYGSHEAGAVFRQLVPGKTLTAKLSAQGELHALTFPLNGTENSALLIRRTTDGFKADTLSPLVETRISLQTAMIQYSLFGAADDAGIPDSVAIQLVDIFGGDIDFHRDLRKGDRFSVIYETATLQGKPIRSQRILAAEFVNDGKTHRAFWYSAKDGSGGYYTADGHSVKKAFLRSPLEFSRITSGFSNARYHPVLREVRAHRGIDYGAPTGTRVKATGDGTIEFAGIQGGYGKVVMIRHAGNKTTVYGHLSGFHSGIRRGTRVSQGDIIGFVGSTGLATGPHLHYEFRVAGVHRNPLAITLPPAAPLPPTQLAVFRTQAADLVAQIGTVRDMQMVMLD